MKYEIVRSQRDQLWRKASCRQTGAQRNDCTDPAIRAQRDAG